MGCAGGDILSSEIHIFIDSIWNKKSFHSSGMNLLLRLFIKGLLKLTALIAQGYHFYQLRTKSHPIFLSQG
jgi:hypothetical protein